MSKLLVTKVSAPCTLFLVHHQRLPSGMIDMQTELMQCVAYGLSTDRLTPDPFNLCSTHTSITQTQPLDMTLSTCTQLVWSTMARPALSGTCPVKLLYGLGHHAAAQFQGLGNLFILYAIFIWSNNSFFFRSSEEFFVMRSGACPEGRTGWHWPPLKICLAPPCAPPTAQTDHSITSAVREQSGCI